MERRTTGAIFCLISAVLYTTRYIAAAILLSGGMGGWNKELFAATMECVGVMPWGLAAIALIVGAVYLVQAERKESSAENQEKNNSIKR